MNTTFSPALEPLAAISTFHLTPATLGRLADGECSCVSYPNEYGGFIYCGTHGDAMPAEVDLAVIVAKARGENIVWIKFDPDASVLEGLPVFDHDEAPKCIPRNDGTIDDRYADSIIGDRHDQYGGLEIHGVRDFANPDGTDGTFCEIVDENPQYHSVYVHLKEGGIECVGDFSKIETANLYADDIARKYGWTSPV